MNIKPTFRYILFAGISLFMFLFAGCSATKNTTSLLENTNNAYASGNYSEALSGYEKLIVRWDENNPREENPYLDEAGHAAFLTGDYEKAIGLFTESMHYGTASVDTYTRLIDYYHEQGNFSREMMTLEGLVEKYPEAPVTKTKRSRLFEMAVEAKQWEMAAEQWQYITDKNELPLLEKYFEVNQRLDNTQRSDSLATVILSRDKNNVPALEWKARKHYESAEERYTSEMEAYERNQTRKQYARLLEELKKANEDYRRARDIYERLYQTNPDKRYAMYLYNIYTRFEDQEKAAYYRARMR